MQMGVQARPLASLAPAVQTSQRGNRQFVAQPVNSRHLRIRDPQCAAISYSQVRRICRFNCTWPPHGGGQTPHQEPDDVRKPLESEPRHRVLPSRASDLPPTTAVLRLLLASANVCRSLRAHRRLIDPCRTPPLRQETCPAAPSPCRRPAGAARRWQRWSSWPAPHLPLRVMRPTGGCCMVLRLGRSASTT